MQLEAFSSGRQVDQTPFTATLWTHHPSSPLKAPHFTEPVFPAEIEAETQQTTAAKPHPRSCQAELSPSGQGCLSPRSEALSASLGSPEIFNFPGGCRSCWELFPHVHLEQRWNSPEHPAIPSSRLGCGSSWCPSAVTQPRSDP